MSKYLVTTAVVEMMVCGYSRHYLHAVGLGGGGDLRDVVRIDGSGSTGWLVNEQIRVVVFADGNRDDLHGAELGGDAGQDAEMMTEADHVGPRPIQACLKYPMDYVSAHHWRCQEVSAINVAPMIGNMYCVLTPTTSHILFFSPMF